MPRGVYPRTHRQREQAKVNLAKGRAPEVRQKVNEKLRRNASDPAWREMVSSQTREAMRRPEVRRRHLAGLQSAMERYGSNFAGGNGQEPVPTVRALARILEPLGYVRELPIKTKGHGTTHRAPNAYKVDFGHPALKVAIEVDGPCHRPTERRQLDRKKTEVLEALGWSVLRVSH